MSNDGFEIYIAPSGKVEPENSAKPAKFSQWIVLIWSNILYVINPDSALPRLEIEPIETVNSLLLLRAKRSWIQTVAIG